MVNCAVIFNDFLKYIYLVHITAETQNIRPLTLLVSVRFMQTVVTK